MATIIFAFRDPQASGIDAPAGGSVRCALLEPESASGAFRSTAAFMVPLASGAGSAVLSAGVWHIEADVEGVAERYVQVPAGEAEIPYAVLPDVDPASVTMTPGAVQVWQNLAAAVAQIDAAGVSVTPHPTFPGVMRIAVTPRPVVTMQPASVHAAAGQAATLVAAASGAPVAVQWQRSQDGELWIDIPGATAETYSTPPLTIDDSGVQFRAAFSNAAGAAVTTPAAVTVTATGGSTPPVVTLHPVGGIYPAGMLVTLTAAASGTPAPTVQWQQRGYPYASSAWQPMPGGSQPAVSFTCVGTPVWYRAVFTNEGGVAVSDMVLITDGEVGG